MTTFAELPVFEPQGADVHAALTEASRRAPMHRSADGCELLTYALCERVLRDENWLPTTGRLVEEHATKGVVLDVAEGLHLLSSEGADHARARRAVMPWFNVRRAEDLRARTRQAVRELMSAATERGACELQAEIAEPLPARVFCWMVGAPDSDSEEIKRLSLTINKIFRPGPDDMPVILGAIKSLRAFTERLIAVKRREPGDDLTSCLLQAVRDGVIEDRDVASLIQEILAASSDNTAHMAALMMWTLCRHPAELERVRRDPALIPSAVEECMRVTPRFWRILFYNRQPCEFAGVSFPAMTQMAANFAVANRDPLVFPDPDRFDVGRKDSKPLLAFGSGRHHCIGAAVARMELQEILRGVTEEWQDIRIEKPVEPVATGTMATGLPALPLRFARAGRTS